jgi:hypothetical protein
MPCESRPKVVSVSFMATGTAVSGSLQGLFARQLSVIPTYLVYDSGVIPSKYLALGSLATKQERLGIRAVAADLE